MKDVFTIIYEGALHLYRSYPMHVLCQYCKQQPSFYQYLNEKLGQFVPPCIRLPRLKFELTISTMIQQSGKTLATVQYNIEVGQLFSQETTSNIQEKEFIISKTISD